jgi:mannosylfructose-phosphate synthase
LARWVIAIRLGAREHSGVSRRRGAQEGRTGTNVERIERSRIIALPRIAMISTHGYVAAQPPLGAADTGGQVVYVLELSKKLAQLGYSVDIWTRRFEEQPSVEMVQDRVRILRVPCGGTRFIAKEYLSTALDEWIDRALRSIQRDGLRYELVDSHYWDGGIAGRQLSRELGVLHVHTPHSIGVWKQRQMLADYPGDGAKFERAYNFRERNAAEAQLYADADLIIATTVDQFDLLRVHYAVSPAKLRMIPPGYDDSRFFPVGSATRGALRKRFGFEGKVVLSLGRLARNKGYDLLIRAFAEVAARSSDARLHLAIGGERLEPAEERILSTCRGLASELGLSERVTFAGFVPESEIADLYRAADVFVLPSRYEPFGMTAIEAMACGTPTVVTTHGGLFRVLRFGISGLFADPLDPADLGITILKALQHAPLAQRLSRYGGQTARRLFTWTGIAQQLMAAVDRPPSALTSAAEELAVEEPSRA